MDQTAQCTNQHQLPLLTMTHADHINEVVYIFLILLQSQFILIIYYHNFSMETDSPLSASEMESINLGEESDMHSDVEEEEMVAGNDESLKDKLVSWQLQYHVPHLHCDKLLHILKPFHPELPLCTRTLLESSRNKVQLSNIPPGHYKHFGIEAGVLKTFALFREHASNPLKLFVGIDDVKLNKSSSSMFTSLVGYIPSLPDSSPFEIGVFHAYSKAEDSNELLSEFVAEAKHLYTTGLDIDGVNIRVVIAALICDAPARATVLCVKGHSSDKHGCTRCTGSGIYVGQPRTNQTFRRKECPEHHHKKSIIEELPYFDMVRDVPLDPMHLFDLGILRRLLTFLFGTVKGRNIRGVTLPNQAIANIDTFLISLRKFISRIDFARQPRSTKQLCRWKATELRLFLHYLGVVVLKEVLSSEYYIHFLCLHVAVKLLSCGEQSRNNIEYARELLTYFVEHSQRLYSKNFVSYNVHALLHVVDDVLRFGALDSFSAYRFENHYGLMKLFLRKNDKPLQQLVKRLDEKNRNSVPSNQETLEKDSVHFTLMHMNGPLPPIHARCIANQFKKAERVGKWKITIDEPDNCVFLKDLSVVVVINFVKTFDNRNVIIGQKFSVQQDVYEQPIRSSALNEYKVSHLSNMQAWDINDVLYKAVKIPETFPHGNSFIVFPLIR